MSSEKTSQHVLFLDHLRGLAILAVFVFHCMTTAFVRDQLGWGSWFRDFRPASGSYLLFLPVTFGWVGVAIFFVVSGFCIHLSFLKGKPHDWRGFLIRRFFRIYPPYLLALLVFALVFPLTRISPADLKSWTGFLSHVFLLHNFEHASFYGINGSFWSIALEAQLCLLYPALVALTRRFGWRKTMIGLGLLEASLRCGVGFAVTVTGSEAPHWISESPIYFWFSWATGAALAEAFVRREPLPFRTLSPWLLLGAAVFSSYVRQVTTVSFLLFALLTAVVMARLLEREQTLPWPPRVLDFLKHVGIWSYSLYLLHQPLVNGLSQVLHSLAHPLHPILIFAACLGTCPLVLALSWLSYRYGELHSIALGKLLLRRTA